MIHNFLGSDSIFYIIAICLLWLQFRRDIKNSLKDFSVEQDKSIEDKLSGLKKDLITTVDNRYNSLDNRLKGLEEHVKSYEQGLKLKSEQQQKELQLQWDYLKCQMQEERGREREEEELKNNNQQKEDFLAVVKLLATSLNHDYAYSFYKLFYEAGWKKSPNVLLQMVLYIIKENENSLSDIFKSYKSYDLVSLREKIEAVISSIQKASDDFGQKKESWNEEFDRRKMDVLIQDYEIFRGALRKYYTNFKQPEWDADKFIPLSNYLK